jgi:hypothetical protein
MGLGLTCLLSLVCRKAIVLGEGGWACLCEVDPRESVGLSVPVPSKIQEPWRMGFDAAGTHPLPRVKASSTEPLSGQEGVGQMFFTIPYPSLPCEWLHSQTKKNTEAVREAGSFSGGQAELPSLHLGIRQM